MVVCSIIDVLLTGYSSVTKDSWLIDGSVCFELTVCSTLALKQARGMKVGIEDEDEAVTSVPQRKELFIARRERKTSTTTGCLTTIVMEKDARGTRISGGVKD